jgi:uncharacterized protein
MHEREKRGRVLVAIAKAAIGDPVSDVSARAWDDPWLEELAATFVTLKKDGALRGCIGSLEARRPLGVDVADNARAAAFRDPRFPPVEPVELFELEIEISVLSPREVMPVRTEEEALSHLRPGIDGVVLEFGGNKATFLPQVWEGLPEPEVFLSELRRKAQLPPRFWHPQMRISRYTVEKYP